MFHQLGGLRRFHGTRTVASTCSNADCLPCTTTCALWHTSFGGLEMPRAAHAVLCLQSNAAGSWGQLCCWTATAVLQGKGYKVDAVAFSHRPAAGPAPITAVLTCNVTKCSLLMGGGLLAVAGAPAEGAMENHTGWSGVSVCAWHGHPAGAQDAQAPRATSA